MGKRWREELHADNGDVIKEVVVMIIDVLLFDQLSYIFVNACGRLDIFLNDPGPKFPASLVL